MGETHFQFVPIFCVSSFFTSGGLLHYYKDLLIYWTDHSQMVL